MSYPSVTDGIVSVLPYAKGAADDNPVLMLGGATVGQAYLNAGLLMRYS